MPPKLFFLRDPAEGGSNGAATDLRPMGTASDAALSDEAMTAYADGRTPPSAEPSAISQRTATAPREGGLDPQAENQESTPEGQQPPATETPPADPNRPWAAGEDFVATVPWGKEQLALKGTQGFQKLVQLASMGYNASQIHGQVKQERADIQRLQDYYGAIDNAAKQNPEWWSHVQESFKNRNSTQGKQGDNPTAGTGEMPPWAAQIAKRLEGLESNLNPVMDKFKTEEQHREDTALDEDIKAFKSTHPDFGWNDLGEDNLTLADRIVVYAHKNGIKSFKSAARDFLFEDATKRAAFKAKEAPPPERPPTGNPPAPRTNAPVKRIVNRTPKGLTPPKDVTNRSYDDLIQEGIAELG